MAKQFYGTFYSIAGIEYTCELWDGPSGTSTPVELALASPGFSVERQGESDTFFDNPIRASRVTVPFVLTTDAQLSAFQAIATSPENAWAVKVYRGTALHYVGQVLCDQMRFERADPDGKVIVNIAAVDALNIIDGFKVDEAWFTNDRASALDIILNCIAYAELDGYWGATDDYLKDGVRQYDTAAQVLSDEKLAFFSVHKLSLVDNYDPFKDASELEYISAKAALERVLDAFGARIFLDAGSYFVTQAPVYTSSTYVFHKYDKSGGYNSTETITHGKALGTLPARPQWAAKPQLYYQPPVRISRLNIGKRNGKYSAKTTWDTSGHSMTWTDWRDGYPFRAKIDIEMAAPSSIWVNSLILYYRAYIFDGVNYWQYFQSWVNSGAGVPDYIEESVKRPYYARKKWPHTLILDFGDPSVIASAQDFVIEIYAAEFNPNYVTVGGNKGWNPTQTIAINFTSTLALSQAYNTAEPLEFSKDVTTSSSNANTGNSVLQEREFNYYDAQRYDIGTIQVWNGSNFVNPTSWAIGWQAGYSAEFSQTRADQVTALYNTFIQVVRGTWHDNGTLNAYNSLSFDGYTWLLNGCNYEAQSETWSGEWLRIAKNYTAISSDGETSNYVPSEKKYFEERLNKVQSELSRLNNVQALHAEYLIADILQVAQFAPTTDPGTDISLSVGLAYDSASTSFQWATRELGKSLNVTSDITSFPTEYEIFICDTSGGSITIDLPAPPSVTPGLRFGFIKSASANSLTLDAGAGYQINDAQLKSWNARFETYWVQSDGTQWYIVASDK